MCVCVATRAFFVVEATSSIFILIMWFLQEKKREKTEKPVVLAV